MVPVNLHQMYVEMRPRFYFTYFEAGLYIYETRSFFIFYFFADCLAGLMTRNCIRIVVWRLYCSVVFIVVCLFCGTSQLIDRPDEFKPRKCDVSCILCCSPLFR